ncbi:MAG TPA: hypothetical protein VGV60_14675 [Candidatus Polarisedimenticolia bacterium]|jgi:hypothetical protein|nr:hypothetical protein [Candidatus Polarisedimenticolia bacterium]
MRFRGWGRRAIVLGAVAAGLTGCTNESPSLHIVPVIPPANVPISFSDVQRIFSRSCAKTSCHAGSSAPYGLSLEEGHSYANLVDVQSAQEPLLKRVEREHSELSYIIRKLEGNGLFARMPADGPPYLPDAEIQLIKDWINEGASDI